MRRFLALPLLLALISFARAETFKMNYIFGGKVAGSEVWDIKPDGSFESSGTMEIAGQKVSSVMTGRFVGQKLAAYTIAIDAGPQKVQTSWDGKKIAMKVNEKDLPARDFVHEPLGAFTNTHLQLARGVLAGYDAEAGGKQSFKALSPESGQLFNTAVTRLGSSQAEIAGKPVAITRWNLEVNVVSMEVVTAEDGKILGISIPVQYFKAIVEGYEDIFVDPTTKMPELSQPVFTTRVEKAVKVPMRDGTVLIADVVVPDAPGKYPAILSRTPYGREGMTMVGEWWAKRGYVVVSQDCRGRGASSGDWLPFENERKDGYDTVQWVASQPWCDGNVGMIGGSYGGLVQWAAAVEQPPALKAIIPQVSPPTAFFNIPWDFGVFFLYGNVWWAGIVKDKVANFSGFTIPKTDGLLTLPVDKVDDAVWGRNIPFYDSWVKRDKPSDYPGFNYMREIEKVRLPVLMISGWFDGDGIGTKLNWEAQRKGGNPNRWLIYGPWHHVFNSSTSIGDVDFGPSSVLELDSVYLRFFDTHLKGKKANWEKTPRVQAFATGANEWKHLDDWPPANSEERAFFLGADGPANGKTSLGTLLDKPAAAAEPSRYTYNPANVEVPKELEDADVATSSFYLKLEDFEDESLLFKSAPLSEPMTVLGPIRAELYFSTSAKDTDFFVTIYDMDPSGRLRVIGKTGKIGAKYINGWDKPRLLTPGRTYRATIEHWDTMHRFEKGHRLVLGINSSQFPIYARNLNTGEPLFGATRMVTAHQTIYHDDKRPSVLKLRVLK
jgi:putative CocE/NonD family hydrolase